MNGKILIKKPNICVCFIKIDETVKQLGAFKTREELDIPFGTHKINVAIEYSDTENIGEWVMDKQYWSDLEWDWKEDKEIIIDETITNIKIKRKCYLLKNVTTEAEISK